MLEIHPPLLLYQGVVFVVFAYLMYRFVYRPLAKTIRDRKAYIESTINRAEEERANAERARAEYDNRLVGIEGERKRILETALADGNRVKEEVVAEGRNEANRLLENARWELEKERRRAVREAKADLGSIAVGIVRKFLKKKMDRKAEQAFIGSIAQDLGARQWKK